MNYFSITEFFKLGRRVRDDLMITPDIADKIIKYHMSPLDTIRGQLGVPIHITSGYRPVLWEHARNRSGDSHHCFKEKGAVDISLYGNKGKYNELLRLIEETGYTRICWYPDKNFMHLDLSAPQRLYYIDYGEGWIQQDDLKI